MEPAGKKMPDLEEGPLVQRISPDGPVVQGGDNALALRGQDGLALELRRIRRTGHVQARRHDIRQAPRLLPQLTRRLDVPRPIKDRRRRHSWSDSRRNDAWQPVPSGAS
jgi:hypothetical protein